MVDELKATYMNNNPLLRWFFRKKVDVAIGLSGLRRKDTILDFGCGAGWLKNKLREKGLNVIGYDVTPKHSDVDDYAETKPDKIFAMDVFEHIPREEIVKIVRNFKKMNPSVELITAIPTENLLSRKVRRLLGKSERVSDHITPLKDILKILNNEFRLVKKTNFLGVSWIGRFRS